MQNFHHNGICPIRDIISRLGNKWALLVLLALNSNGTMRYNEIQKSLGDISERMLSLTLHNLYSDGLINRTIYPQVPPRVDYCLSDMGCSLIPNIKSLVEWAANNSDTIMQSRSKKAKRID